MTKDKDTPATARALLAGLVLAVTAVAAAAPSAQDAVAKRRLEFESRRTKILAEASQRHLRHGSWCRKQGLVAQATAQFLRAQEVGAGNNPGADTVVNLMRSLDDRFWRGIRAQPPGRLLRQHEAHARDLEKKNQKDRQYLAQLAQKLDLTDEAIELYETLLAEHDGPLQFDDKGRIPIDGGFVPKELAARFQAQTVQVDGEPQIRDPLLRDAPEIGAVFETSTRELSVRSDQSAELTAELHALLTALLPHLEERIGGRPTRQLRVFVFKQRASLEKFMTAAGYGTSHADGLFDPASFTALVCAEGREPAVVQAIALHELTHGYEFGVSPVVFPSWYAEAFAETFGGIGTFSFEGGELRVGGKLQDYRLDPLRKDGPPFPLPDMLKTRAMDLLRQDPDRAALFYAQAWAFLRYLRTGAGEEIAEKLRVFELRCRGASVGALPGQRRQRDELPAAELFQRMFGADLDELDKGFRAWLRTL